MGDGYGDPEITTSRILLNLVLLVDTIVSLGSWKGWSRLYFIN